MNKSQLDILLVDDSEQELSHLHGLLSEINSWQCNLEQVADYESALKKIQQTEPDICLLNPELSIQNGLNHLNQIFENNGSTALILLTKSDKPNGVADLENAEVVDHLTRKELDASRLERSFENVTRYKQLKKTLEKDYSERVGQLTHENKLLRKELIQWKHEAAVSQEQHGLYQDLFNVDIYGVEVLDVQGNITDSNVTYQKLLGYSRAEIVGQHTTAFASGADKNRLNVKFEQAKEQGYAEGEIELVCKDGSKVLVWRRLRATHDEQQHFTGVVSYNRDITERMTAVRQISTLARALEQSPKAILIADGDGIIEYVNFRFTELTGYSYDEAVGQALNQIKSEKQSPETFQEIWEAITEGDEWGGEFYNLNREGEAYWEEVSIAPMFSSQGAITHFVAVQEDITARKMLEAEALHSQQRVGDLMTTQISDLTTANEQLQQEIADRKRAEKELRRNRARLKAQYKGIPVPTYTWQKSSNDLVLVDYNDVAEQESQGRIIDFIGKPVSEVFQNDPQVIADFERCFSEKRAITREAPYKLVTTGEVKYFVTTYNHVPPHLVIVHIQDVTKRRQLEEQLKTYQTDPPNLSGQTDELAKIEASLQDEIEQRQKIEAEFKDYRTQIEKSLREGAVELKILQEKVDQEIKKRAAVEQILQESEERFQQIAGNIDDRLREQYRSIPVPTYSWQRIQDEFILIDFNDAAADNMGKIVDFFGKAASEIFKDRPEILADFERCYQEKAQVVREAPYTMITTGETRYFVTTYNFVPPNLVIDHIQDITHQKQIEAELEEYRQQVESLTNQETPQIAELNHKIEQEVQQRRQAESALEELKGQIKAHHDQLEDTVKERTVELTETNKRLQREIFERQRTEESLREARARLKTQYKGMPIPTYSWRRVGHDFVLVDYNDAAEKSSHGRIAQFVSKKASEIFEDRTQVLTDFAECFNTKKTVRRKAPYRLVTTGETKFFITTYNFAPPNLIIVYIQDITETKQLEATFQESMEQVELNCRFSPEGTLTFVNDAYCWYFDESREKLIGRIMPFILDEDRKKITMHLNSLHQDEPVGSTEYRVLKADGSIRWQRWISRAIFDKQGRIVEYRSSGKDITRSKAPDS